MPKKGVSSAPEYVVGTLTWATTGRSTWLAPGIPASCSRKKHTALPRSAHEPPPKDTTTSIASRRAWSSAAWTEGAGTWDVTSANVDASDRPSLATTCSPSGDAARPAVVTSSARRAPIVRRRSGRRPTLPSPNTICWARAVWVHAAGIARTLGLPATARRSRPRPAG